MSLITLAGLHVVFFPAVASGGRCAVAFPVFAVDRRARFGVMRNPVKQARLKYIRGQAFACGMFGLCVHDVLSPRSPPALQDHIIKALSEGKCPVDQESCLARVTSDAGVSRMSPARSALDFEASTGLVHDGKVGEEAAGIASPAACTEECAEEHRCGIAGQFELRDDCPRLRIVSSSDSSVERSGVMPDSPYSAARVLGGASPPNFVDCEDPSGSGALMDQGVSRAADSPFHYDVLMGPETASSSKQSDVHIIDAFLREMAGGRPSRLTSVSLLKLAKESERYRKQMLAAEIVPALVSMFAASEMSAEAGVGGLEEAFSLLALFAANEDVRSALAVEPSVLSVLSAASYFLNMGSPNSRVDAAYMVEKLSVVDSLKQVVGTCSLIMEGVVNLLSDRSLLRTEADVLCTKSRHSSEQAQVAERQRKLVKSATKTLLALCLEKDNRLRAVEAGAVQALLETLPDARSVSAERALATLELLATTAEGRAAMTSHALGIPILVGMILKVSNRGTEYAAGALCAICSTGSTCVQEAAIQAGAPTQLLLLLQSDCTPRARRKAMQLLKLLHKLWEESPCNPDSFLIRSKAVLL